MVVGRFVGGGDVGGVLETGTVVVAPVSTEVVVLVEDVVVVASTTARPNSVIRRTE